MIDKKRGFQLMFGTHFASSNGIAAVTENEESGHERCETLFFVCRLRK